MRLQVGVLVGERPLPCIGQQAVYPLVILLAGPIRVEVPICRDLRKGPPLWRPSRSRATTFDMTSNDFYLILDK